MEAPSQNVQAVWAVDEQKFKISPRVNFEFEFWPVFATAVVILCCHPIYSGMLGILLATGLVISHWLALIAAIVVYVIGTVIRIRSEERLLREALGPEFEAYARSAPALIPGLY